MKEKEDLIRTYGNKLIMEALRLSVTKKGGPDPFLHTSHWICPWKFSLELPWNRSTQSVEVRLQYYSEPELCSRQKHLTLSAGPFFCLLDERSNQFRFLGNCPLTPPQAQHLAPSETQMLTLS